MATNHHSVLVVTKDEKISALVAQMLQEPMFSLTVANDFNEARRILNEVTYNIVIVDSGDGSDTDFAIDVSSFQSVVLLLAPAHLFDRISYRVECYGILTLTKPFDAFYFYNMIKVAIAVRFKIESLTSQTVKLKEKMEEIRIVNRAKMLLMQHENMSEDEAHHAIEKRAMDACAKRVKIAKEIIRRYSN